MPSNERQAERRQVKAMDWRLIHVLGRAELDALRFQLATQNSEPFKVYKLFISQLFHFIFLDHGLWRVTESAESRTADYRGSCTEAAAPIATRGLEMC